MNGLDIRSMSGWSVVSAIVSGNFSCLLNSALTSLSQAVARIPLEHCRSIFRLFFEANCFHHWLLLFALSTRFWHHWWESLPRGFQKRTRGSPSLARRRFRQIPKGKGLDRLGRPSSNQLDPELDLRRLGSLPELWLSNLVINGSADTSLPSSIQTQAFSFFTIPLSGLVLSLLDKEFIVGVHDGVWAARTPSMGESYVSDCSSRPMSHVSVDNRFFSLRLKFPRSAHLAQELLRYPAATASENTAINVLALCRLWPHKSSGAVFNWECGKGLHLVNLLYATPLSFYQPQGISPQALLLYGVYIITQFTSGFTVI